MSQSLEALRNEARRLKKAFREGDAQALARLSAHVDTAAPKHADFLHVIARENGADSWPKLKFLAEAAALSRAEKAEQLKYALYNGQDWRVRQLLADTPDLAEHDLGLLCATYDLEKVRTAVATRPEAATDIVGVRSPILHLAFSRYHKMAPEKRGDMLAIAELLVANGADVNDGYPAEPGSEHLLTALYGALGHADNLALAEWLLEHGASPDDNESLYHSTELGHVEGVKLLARFNANPQGTNALLRAIDFDNAQMVQILLDLGADPNAGLSPHPSGQPVDGAPALHHAAYRWAGAEVADLLLKAGADPATEWRGNSAYAVAMTHGNRAIAELLEARGLATELSDTQKALAAVARGEPVTADLTDAPGTKHLLHRLAAEPGHLRHLRGLIEAGFDPDALDLQGMPPLHLAGWQGLPDYVEYLLTLSPDLTLKNSYGGDALGTVIHGAENCPARATRDHLRCAELLLEAGAPVQERYVGFAPDEEMAELLAQHLAD